MAKRPVPKPKFRSWLKARNLSQARLAAQIQMHPSALSNILTGRRRIQMNEAALLATALKIPAREILAEFNAEYTAPFDRIIKVTGSVEDNDSVRKKGEWDPDFGLDEVEVPFIPFTETVALRIETHTLSPRYLPGEIIGHLDQLHPSVVIGREAIACLEDGSQHMKRVEAGSVADRYTLLSIGGNGPPLVNVAIEWASPLLWKIPRPRS